MPHFELEVYAATAKGKKTDTNEDCYQCVDTLNGSLFIVCDGLGGLQGEGLASQMACNSIVVFSKRELQ